MASQASGSRARFAPSPRTVARASAPEIHGLPTRVRDMTAVQPLLPLGGNKVRSLVSEAVIECRDNLPFMRSLASESIKLLVTSPPYNLGKEYEKKHSRDEYLKQQKAVIREAVRLLHPDGSICWQVGNYVENGEIEPLDIILYPLFKDEGLQLRNRIIWTYGHGLHCQNCFSGRYETILWFTGNLLSWNSNLLEINVIDMYSRRSDRPREVARRSWKKAVSHPAW